MGLPHPRRLTCVILLTLFCGSTIGCNANERVETALASAFATPVPANVVGTRFAQPPPPRPRIAVVPQVVGRSTSTPPRAMTALVPPASSSVATPSRSAAPANTIAKLSSNFPIARDLRVMSFNLRIPFLLDGTNHWGFRKSKVVETIKEFGPDILGTQECVADQADFLREELAGYGFRGVGRNDGKRRGEMAAIFFRHDKFREVDHGHFWLSTRPDVPGSKSWGAWSTRMCTWVKLQPLDGSPAFAVFNAHLDNMSSRSREESARLMHQRIRSIAGGMPVIVTGDFNADAGSEPYRLLLAGEQLGVPQLLFDAYRLANPKVKNDEGTRHDFNGKRGGNRIDWVLCNTGFTPVSAQINRTRGLLGYPSDHYPVQVVLRPTAISAPTIPVARIE